MQNTKKKRIFEKDFLKQSLEICQIQAELFYMLAQKQDHKIFTIIMKDIEKVFESKQYIDPRSHVFEEYHDLLDMFEKKNTDKLPPHKDYNIKIELKLEKMLNFESLYSILQKKLQVL